MIKCLISLIFILVSSFKNHFTFNTTSQEHGVWRGKSHGQWSTFQESQTIEWIQSHKLSRSVGTGN